MTAEELLRLREPGWHHELVRGELRRLPFRGGVEGQIVLRISASLSEHARLHALGSALMGTGFLLGSDPDTVRAPAVAFVRKERADSIGEGYVPGAPDLAVEVVPPDDRFAEVEENVLEWLDAGSRMALVVDPWKRVVTEYRSRDEIRVLREGDVLTGGEVAPGWEVPVRELFA